MSNSFFDRFNLFIPGKSTKEVAQPGYGTDMRTIEICAKNIFAEIVSVTDQFVVSINQSPIFSLSNTMVGSTPPPTTRLKASMFIESVSVSAGSGSVAISGFTTGYNVQLTPSGAVGLTYTLNPSGSSLSHIAFFVFDDTGAPFTGSDSASFFVVGA